VIEFLKPEQCVDIVIARARARIRALEDGKLAAYKRSIHELKVVLDLLERPRNYMVNVSSKRSEG
jgi:hypothetical protein